MELFFSKMSIFIFFFSDFCFIPIVVCPASYQPITNPRSSLPTLIQKTCFDYIHLAFRGVHPENRSNKKEYFQYALIHFRYLSNDEYYDYIRSAGSEEISQYLLYDGYFRTINDDKYSFTYYQQIADKFMTENILRPEIYCLVFQVGFEQDCIINLDQNGFRGSIEEIVEFVYENIVLSDYTTLDNTSILPGFYYPYMYMLYLHEAIKTIRYEMIWPENYCGTLD